VKRENAFPVIQIDKLFSISVYYNVLKPVLGKAGENTFRRKEL